MINLAILRRIKIDVITDNTNPIVEWFDKYWDGLLIFKTNIADGSIFYYKPRKSDDDILPYRTIFYLNSKDDKFFCDNVYWDEFGKMFNLSYTEVQLVTKFLTENKLGGTNMPIPNKDKWCIPHDTDILLNVLLKK